LNQEEEVHQEALIVAAEADAEVSAAVAEVVVAALAVDSNKDLLPQL
jgi:hypothetical protein